MKTSTTNNRYENVKASLKAELGKAYPTNINGLKDAFICEKFAPMLELDDMIIIDAKRDEFRSATKRNENGEEVKVPNWYPAFRSWVGQTYFPEFGKKVSTKKVEDKNGDSLKALIASRKANL